jgi:hypothetical protein
MTEDKLSIKHALHFLPDPIPANGSDEPQVADVDPKNRQAGTTKPVSGLKQRSVSTDGEDQINLAVAKIRQFPEEILSRWQRFNPFLPDALAVEKSFQLTGGPPRVGLVRLMTMMTLLIFMLHSEFWAPCGILEQLPNQRNGFAYSFLVWTAQNVPGHTLGREGFFKPAMHLVADVFAITKTVLNEGNLVASKQVKITATVPGDFLNSLAVAAHVTTMPKHGSERVGVADQHAVRPAGGSVFAAHLFF